LDNQWLCLLVLENPSQNVNQSVATSSKKTVATDSTVKKSRNASRTANILEHKTPRCSSTMSNTPLSSNSFAARTVKFGNGQIALILSYGDLVQETITIKQGNDILTGSRGIDLYSITLQDLTTPNPIFLMAKATSS
ncbi:hypothetical protein Tco_0124209, partial [Tanacetum coccineum]